MCSCIFSGGCFRCLLNCFCSVLLFDFNALYVISSDFFLPDSNRIYFMLDQRICMYRSLYQSQSWKDRIKMWEILNAPTKKIFGGCIYNFPQDSFWKLYWPCYKKKKDSRATRHMRLEVRKAEHFKRPRHWLAFSIIFLHFNLIHSFFPNQKFPHHVENFIRSKPSKKYVKNAAHC